MTDARHIQIEPSDRSVMLRLRTYLTFHEGMPNDGVLLALQTRVNEAIWIALGQVTSEPQQYIGIDVMTPEMLERDMGGEWG